MFGYNAHNHFLAANKRKHNSCLSAGTKILQELRLMSFTPINRNTCKSCSAERIRSQSVDGGSQNSVQVGAACRVVTRSGEIVSNEEFENTRRKQRTALKKHSPVM